MQVSNETVLTTQFGNWPRSKAVTETVLALETGQRIAIADDVIFAAVMAVVDRQVGTAVDVVSDGEMSEFGYATCIVSRERVIAGTDRGFSPCAGFDAGTVYAKLVSLAEQAAIASQRAWL
ncbi:MAG: hypothetical protein AAGH76_15500 [Pseudomonadota bacterium]